MKPSWKQPSLSRDFVLLSAAILFILSLISAWVTYITYTKHTERITHELENESARIERALAVQMESTAFLLTAMGRQIVIDPDRSPDKLAKMLKSYYNRGYVYDLFSWIDPTQQVLVSSNRGVLDHPVDISDRDYIQRIQAEPWRMTLGKPIEGRISGDWVMPAAMGLTDYTGKFIGTLMISIDINVLSNQISAMIKRDGISFAIISKSLMPLTQVSEDKDFVKHNFPESTLENVDFTKASSGLLAQGGWLEGTGNYVYYRVSQAYPYIILLGYDAHYSDESMYNLLWSRLLQLLAMAVFFMLFFWIVRTRLVKPVLDMTAITSMVARGQACVVSRTSGPVEIRELATQIFQVSEYIEETKRIEDELRNKAFMLNRAREQTEMEMRSKMEFVAYTCQSLRPALNNIIGFAQVMKDQLYGPIENRKYKKYIADIYTAANQLMATTQDMQTLVNAQTGLIAFQSRPVSITEAVNSALHAVADKMHLTKCMINVQLPDALPRINADEFRLQQLFSNLLLYMLDHVPQGSTLLCEARVMDTTQDKAALAFIIGGPMAQTLPSAAEPDENDMRLELAKTLVGLLGGLIDLRHSSEDNAIAITLLFSGKSLDFTDDTKNMG